MEWLGIRHKSFNHIIMTHHNSPQLTTCLSNANNERGFLAKAGTQAQHGTAWHSMAQLEGPWSLATLKNGHL